MTFDPSTMLQNLQIVALCLVVTSTCTLSCIPELTIEDGRYIVYEHSQSRTPCGGTVRHLDDFVQFVAGELGVSIAASYRYSWLDQHDSKLAGVRCDVSDCAIGRHAIAFFPAHKHEVVHLVMQDVSYTSIPFFAEGIAGAYDPLVDGRGGPYPSQIRIGDPRVTMAGQTSQEVDYAAAAGFVAFLLTRHGPEKFREFYFRLRLAAGMPAIRRHFGAAYGIDLDDEVEIYMAGPPPCEPDHFTVLAYECKGPSRSWSDSVWAYTDTLECSDEDVVGGVGEHQWRSHRTVTVDVPAGGYYDLRLDSEPGVELRLGPCFGCVWDREDSFVTAGENRLVYLDPGTHFVRITADSEQTPSFSAVLKPAL